MSIYFELMDERDALKAEVERLRDAIREHLKSPGALTANRKHEKLRAALSASAEEHAADRERLRDLVNVYARLNHSKAVELGLTDRNFDECQDPMCVAARAALSAGAEQEGQDA